MDGRGSGYVVILLRHLEELLLEHIIVLLYFDFEFLQVSLELVDRSEVAVLHHRDLLLVLLFAFDLRIQHGFDPVDLIGELEHQLLKLLGVVAGLERVVFGDIRLMLRFNLHGTAGFAAMPAVNP